MVTEVRGFSKEKVGSYSIYNILKGQIGQNDADFVARHVNDWKCDLEDGSVAPTVGVFAVEAGFSH